jgi:hypothetical protein
MEAANPRCWFLNSSAPFGGASYSSRSGPKEFYCLLHQVKVDMNITERVVSSITRARIAL